MRKSLDTTDLLNSQEFDAVSNPRRTTIREFLFPTALPNHVASAKSIGRLLNNNVDNAVRRGDTTLTLLTTSKHNEVGYFVRITAEAAGNAR